MIGFKPKPNGSGEIMELSHVATTKLGNGNKLLDILRAAAPGEIIDGVHVIFATPKLPEPMGGIHDPVAEQNAEAINCAADAGKKAVEELGVTVKKFHQAIASASISGPAEKIAAMLERPEIKSAIYSKGLVFRLSPIRPMR
jgi:hypothetical protein